MKVLLAILLISPFVSLAQYKVTVIIDKVPAGTTADFIYIMGNFNDWTPGDRENMLLKNQAGKYATTFNDVQAALYEFKFNLGTLESVETKADGSELPNRMLNLQSDTVIHITIAHWKNAPKTAAIQKNNPANTATARVLYRPERLIYFKPE